MSYRNAIAQREQMIVDYKQMLEDENSPNRKLALQSQIDNTQEEIDYLKQGKPLFGRPEPLKQTTTVIESDREKKGEQIITTRDFEGKIIDPEPEAVESEPTPIIPVPPKPQKLGNALRDIIHQATSPTEDSLKAKIAAAKAAKKPN